MSPVFTIDFEASCLPWHGRSFPVEVGVAGPQGLVRSWLIRPAPAWEGWTWTEEAEALHGLSFARLVREGVPADEVLGELVDVLDGQPAYADSYLDERWMRTLEAAAGAPPLVRVRHIDALLETLGVGKDEVRRALEAVNQLPIGRHRAGEDARWLQALVSRLQPPVGPPAEAKARDKVAALA